MILSIEKIANFRANTMQEFLVILFVLIQIQQFLSLDHYLVVPTP
jgi:hypothetical protein